MSFGIAFAILAQIAAPAGSETEQSRATATATASARVLKPAAVRVNRDTGAVVVQGNNAAPAQKAKDALGTVWIEFS